MRNLIKLLLQTLIIIIYDLFTLVRDNIQLLRGQHRAVVSERSGGLPEQGAHARVAIMAMYAEDASAPFVKNLLRALNGQDFFILIISTKRLSTRMSAEVLPLCHHLIERLPVGRDFGSYQMGLRWIETRPSLKSRDTVALVNDSLFYPQCIAATLKEVLARDESWLALFENYQYHYHAQSFFQIFRPDVFKSRAFTKFWRSYRPHSSRRHSINHGEVGFSRTLRKAGFVTTANFSSTRIASCVKDKLNDERCFAELNALLRLSDSIDYFKALRRTVSSSAAAGSISKTPPALAEVVSRDMISNLATLVETRNPTHQVGLLCNYLFGAPIKRDICYREYGDSNRGMHSIADVLLLARFFEPDEMAAMSEDLRRKGVPASLRGLKRLLVKVGRI
jgi:hypothetical protein